MASALLHRRRCLQQLGGAAAWLSATLAGRQVQAAQDLDPRALGQLAPWPPGKAQPELKALALDGQLRSLVDYAGAPLILNFWASYCAPCRLEMA